MNGNHTSFVERDIPLVRPFYADELSYKDLHRLKRVHGVEKKDFVLVRHDRECIAVNKELDNFHEVKAMIDKVMQSKYLPEKLLDKFEELTDRKSADILLAYYLDWRNEQQKKELNRKSMSILKTAKTLRISWEVRRNKEIIKELFDIGFGVYEKGAKCDYQQGAENAFMYGYIVGLQSEKGGVLA